jgi:hypothetical protein
MHFRPAVSLLARWLATGTSRNMRRSLLCLCGAKMCASARVQAEDHFDYKYEDYREENGRIHIQTHTALFSVDLKPWITVKGSYVYDGISGATPTGEAPKNGSAQVPTVQVEDIRRGYNLEVPLKSGSHGFSPQVAYSKESDYESTGVAGTYTFEFNQKNTVFSFGGSHDFDRVSGANQPVFQKKDKTSLLVGLSQILDPQTLLSGNLTLSYSDGFLADPYKNVNFYYEYPDPIFTPDFNNSLFAIEESRPRHRFDQTAQVSLNHFFKSLDGSLNTDYRFFHNDYGIFSHTVTLTWLQKLGENVVLSPFFRFYNQSAASFYGTVFSGDQGYPGGGDIGADLGIPPFGVNVAPPWPSYYSADFRLSRMNTFTYGIGITWKIKDRISLDAAYKRYDMQGLDNVTSGSAYPTANVWTVGLRVWF